MRAQGRYDEYIPTVDKDGSIYILMRDSIMEGQDELIMRKLDSEEVGLEDNNEAVLEDVGYNADLYIANQEVVYN